MSTPEPIDIHDQVQAFADGELSPEEADTFRMHLGTCEQCQADLDDILQLQALGDRLSALEVKEAVQPAAPPRQDATPSRAFRPAWSHRRTRVAATVALVGSLAAVLAVVVLRAPGGTG
ncbi:anti-sigma factor family protein, partial [Pyxidicoccus sp. 3LG]